MGALQEAKAAREKMEYGEEPRALDDVIRRVTVYLMNIRSYSKAERERCQKMWHKDGARTEIYADRRSALTEEERKAKEAADNFTVDDSDEAIEEMLSQARGDWNCF